MGAVDVAATAHRSSDDDVLEVSVANQLRIVDGPSTVVVAHAGARQGILPILVVCGDGNTLGANLLQGSDRAAGQGFDSDQLGLGCGESPMTPVASLFFWIIAATVGISAIMTASLSAFLS